MAAAVEGAQVDFDTAIEIEGRYFVDLVTGQVAKNMIQAFFFDLQAGQRRPRPAGGHRAVRGRRRSSCSAPGMMGAAIAYVCAKAGHRGRPQGRRPGGRRARQGLLGEPRREGRRARPVDRRRRATRCWPGSPRRPTRRPPPAPTSSSRPSSRTRRSRRRSSPRSSRTSPTGALLGSNTSTLPITDLAEGVIAPGRLHRAALLQPGGQDAAAGDHQGRADRATRRSTARSTSPSRSARRRSSSTTAAGSSPAA